MTAVTFAGATRRSLPSMVLHYLLKVLEFGFAGVIAFLFAAIWILEVVARLSPLLATVLAVVMVVTVAVGLVRLFKADPAEHFVKGASG